MGDMTPSTRQSSIKHQTGIEEALHRAARFASLPERLIHAWRPPVSAASLRPAAPLPPPLAAGLTAASLPAPFHYAAAVFFIGRFISPWTIKVFIFASQISIEQTIKPRIASNCIRPAGSGAILPSRNCGKTPLRSAFPQVRPPESMAGMQWAKVAKYRRFFAHAEPGP